MIENNKHTEQELVLQISQGDEAAFTQLFVSYGPLLHPFIVSILKSADMSEEVIQVIFLKLWLKRDQLSDVKHPRAYIFQMASNECFEHMRRSAVKKKHYAAIEDDVSNDPRNNIDSLMTVREIEALVQEAFRLMPRQQQKIYTMSRRESMKIPEIAEQLDISPSTVKNSLVKSLKAIRLHLEKEGYLLSWCLVLLFC